MTSDAITPSGPSGAAAFAGAEANVAVAGAQMGVHAGAGRVSRGEALREHRPDHPGEHVARTRRRERGREAARDRHTTVGRRHQRVVALQHDDRLGLGRGLAGVVEAVAADLLRVDAEQPAELAGVRRHHGRPRPRPHELLHRPAGERTEPVGVDHERDVDALDQLARELLGALLLADPRAQHDGVGAADRLQRGLQGARGQPAVTLRQPDHHRLQQPHREGQLERLGRADRDVARARAHRRQRRHRRCARQPVRAADDEHVAGGELRRARGAAGHLEQHAAPDQADLRLSGRARGDADVDDLDDARVLLAGGDPQPGLGLVEGRGGERPHGRALDFAAGRVDAASDATAATDRVDRRRRGARSGASDHSASAGSRGAPSKPVPSTASTIACAFWSRSGWNGTGAGPGRILT